MPYVALKPMVMFGRPYQPDQEVPAKLLKPRIAQRLLEQRRIVFIPEDRPAPAPVKRRGRPPKAKTLQEA